MLERKISEYIKHFYEVNKGALLLAGARQIGKTYSVRQFAKENFKHLVEINFVESPEAIDIFSNARSCDDILLRLSAFTDKPLVKGETLVFFDEVQRCPEIVTAIKFLVDDGRYRYIMSGSLLGVELNNLRSVPVGYMDIKYMFPLDLEEFMWAVGVKTEIIETIKMDIEITIIKTDTDKTIKKEMVLDQEIILTETITIMTEIIILIETTITNLITETTTKTINLEQNVHLMKKEQKKI